MKTFYRIEDGFGVGLYNSSLGVTYNPLLRAMVDRHLDKSILPNAFNDDVIFQALKDNRNKDFKFYFNSLERLKEIITEEELKALKEMGFKMFEVKASQYISSEYQTILLDYDIL